MVVHLLGIVATHGTGVGWLQAPCRCEGHVKQAVGHVAYGAVRYGPCCDSQPLARPPPACTRHEPAFVGREVLCMSCEHRRQAHLGHLCVCLGPSFGLRTYTQQEEARGLAFGPLSGQRA